MIKVCLPRDRNKEHIPHLEHKVHHRTHQSLSLLADKRHDPSATCQSTCKRHEERYKRMSEYIIVKLYLFIYLFIYLFCIFVEKEIG